MPRMEGWPCPPDWLGEIPPGVLLSVDHRQDTVSDKLRALVKLMTVPESVKKLDGFTSPLRARTIELVRGVDASVMVSWPAMAVK
jgi:hypothetical protein